MGIDGYKQGTVKVVWVEDGLEKISSKMFSSRKEASEFAKNKKDYLIFALEHQNNMEEFCWKLLPYGRHKLYLAVLKTFKRSENSILKIAGQLIK